MPNSLYEQPSFNSYGPTYKRRERSWTVTPNYRSIPKSELPINLYTDYNTLVNHGYWNGAWYVSSSGQVTRTYAAGYPFNATSTMNRMVGRMVANTATINSARDQAWNENLTKVLVRVSDAKVNVGVMLKEASKTSDMIYSTASRLDKAYRSLRKGRFAEVARQLNLPPSKVHKTWLEYKYGWMPLLMDVKGSAEFLAQQVATGRATRFAVKTQTKKEILSEARVLPYVPYGGSVPDANDIETYKVEYIVKHKLFCEITNSQIAQLQQIGLTNPALYVWETIPYSFVFDWLVGVGDYFQAITSLNGITVRKAMAENRTQHSYKYNRPSATQRVSGGVTYCNTPWFVEIPSYIEYGRSSFSPSVGSLRPVVHDLKATASRLTTALALIRARHS